MSISEKYPLMTIEKSIVNRAWAAGSSSMIDHEEYIIRESGGAYAKLTYPPALWKIIDEPIVNAIDHAIKSGEVTIIKISIDAAGRIRVYNNGPGIEVVPHPEASELHGRPIYVPTLVFGHLFQGSNSVKAPDSIVGGENGLGGKLPNLFSLEFGVETVNGKYFLQKWRDHKEIEEPPIVYDLPHPKVPADRAVPHTLVSFLPDYVGLFKYEAVTPELIALLSDVIRTRAYMAAAYLAHGLTHKTRVYFNDRLVPILNMADIARTFFGATPSLRTVIIPEITPATQHYKYPWEIVIVPGQSGAFSTVNGIVVRDGAHISYIRNLVIKSMRDKLEQTMSERRVKFSPSMISNNFFVFITAQIPRPNWTGQRKDYLQLNARMLKGYKFDAKFTAELSGAMTKIITDSVFSAAAAPKTTRKKHVECDKYRAARKAGGKHSKKCTLFLAEGDSALSPLALGIGNTIGWDYNGTLSMRGVIVNARKYVTVTYENGRRIVTCKPTFTNNAFIQSLLEVTGLNLDCEYATQRDIDRLRYGCICLCVDQDLDGMGNILGLFISMIGLIWPNLFDAGYIKWLMTPLIRAYPKSGKVLHFYNEEEFRAVAHRLKNYDIRYYKGIGSHDRNEMIHIFNHLANNMVTYRGDAESARLFDVYFGDVSQLRKEVLCIPYVPPPPELVIRQCEEKVIDCSDHLSHATNLYQRDNIERKLDHVIDGQNQAGRKVLNCILSKLGSVPTKVAPLGGTVSTTQHYAHGETSLYTSITKKGFVATGGRQLPFIVPLSMFGTRLEGGDDAASPRYIWTILNSRITNLLFPAADYQLLPFTFVDGKRCEPDYFAPIVPLAILETVEVPGHGWKLKKWARDVRQVVQNIRRMIKLGPECRLLRMKPCTYPRSPYAWKGEFRVIRGAEHSIGAYSCDGDALTITELPLGVWTTKYVSKLRERAAKDNRIICPGGIFDESSDIDVRIHVKLQPGALDLLDTFADSVHADGVEEYFGLVKKMGTHLNFSGFDRAILSFTEYDEIIRYWFPVRRDYYVKRVERETILVNLNIVYFRNVLRFIEESPKLKNIKKAEMEQILDDDGYDRLSRKFIKNPDFTPTNEIEALVRASNFDYLLCLSSLDKTAERVEKLRAKLAKLEETRDMLAVASTSGRFPGAILWEQELDAFITAVDEGEATMWRYGDSTKYEL